jgi:hypothetical protein
MKNHRAEVHNIIYYYLEYYSVLRSIIQDKFCGGIKGRNQN